MGRFFYVSTLLSRSVDHLHVGGSGYNGNQGTRLPIPYRPAYHLSIPGEGGIIKSNRPFRTKSTRKDTKEKATNVEA